MFRNILILSLFAFLQSTSIPTPAVFDWRTEGAIRPVTTVQGCQHASIINVLDAIAASYKITKDYYLTQLSTQELYDCVEPNWCKCNYDTSSVKDVVDKIQNSKYSHKLDTEATYAYSGFCNSKCDADTKTAHTSLTGYKAASGESEQALYSLLQQGPVIVTVNVSAAFQEYAGGIFAEDKCTGKSTQSLLLVGYGTTAEGQDYWIARNTMGEQWGEKGYIRFIRNQNICSIGNNWVQVYAGGPSS